MSREIGREGAPAAAETLAVPRRRGARVGELSGLLICAAAVAVRLWLAWWSPPSYDMKWYWSPIAHAMDQGIPLYEGTAYHFSPLWSWLLLLFQRLSRRGIPFDASLRTFLTAADVAAAWLLLRISRQRGIARWRWKAPVLFLTNPVSIWVSSVQGQFDNLALLFLLAALLASRESETTGRRAPRIGFLLFLSVAAKQVTLFHPLLWVRRRRGALIVSIAYLATAALFLPYARQWRAIIDRLAFYSSVPRSYGFSELVLYDARYAPWIGALDAAAALAAAWALRKQPLARASLVLFLVILIFAPGLGSQYLIWPLTIGSLFGGWRYFLFTGASMAWIIGSLYDVIGSGRWMGHLIWLSAVLWAIGELGLLWARPRVAAVAAST